jgi:hypothetical protein
MIGGQIGGGESPAPGNGRAAGESFQAVAVERADTGKGVSRSAGNLDVTELRMEGTVDQATAGTMPAPIPVPMVM